MPLIKGSDTLLFRPRARAGDGSAARPLPLRAEWEWDERFGADLEVGNDEVDWEGRVSVE